MWALVRLLRASWLFGRIFLSYVFQLALQKIVGRKRLIDRWRRLHRKNAKRLYRGIIRLRGVYIKLGQVLSIMGTFLPRAYAEELEGLQDQVPPHPVDEMERTFRASLGKRPSEVFQAFDRKPLAAASLGQVHRATLAGGEEVAVKILYPNVATVIAIDMRVLGWAVKVYKRFMPIKQIERVADQIRDLLTRETNYLHEAACLERMAANFTADADILFPAVHRELTTDQVLTMSFMPGIKISNVAALAAEGIDPEATARRLVEAFYKQLFVDRFFHADPHPGNFLVQKGPDGKPRIVMLDFGAATETRANHVDGMLEFLRGMFGRDDSLVLKGIETMGFVAPGGDRALLEKSVKHYFEKLLSLNIQDFGKIKPADAARLVDPGVKREELRGLLKSVEYPEGWFFIERAIVILFGLCAQLAPRMNAIAVGFPYVMRALAAQPQPQAQVQA